LHIFLELVLSFSFAQFSVGLLQKPEKQLLQKGIATSQLPDCVVASSFNFFFSITIVAAPLDRRSPPLQEVCESKRERRDWEQIQNTQASACVVLADP
jgi:hypothetical protein